MNNILLKDRGRFSAFREFIALMAHGSAVQSLSLFLSEANCVRFFGIKFIHCETSCFCIGIQRTKPKERWRQECDETLNPIANITHIHNNKYFHLKYQRIETNERIQDELEWTKDSKREREREICDVLRSGGCNPLTFAINAKWSQFCAFMWKICEWIEYQHTEHTHIHKIIQRLFQANAHFLYLYLL